MLSVGTTLGVVVLSAVPAHPAAPAAAAAAAALRFPATRRPAGCAPGRAGCGHRRRQQLALLVAIRLANATDGRGAVAGLHRRADASSCCPGRCSRCRWPPRPTRRSPSRRDRRRAGLRATRSPGRPVASAAGWLGAAALAGRGRSGGQVPVAQRRPAPLAGASPRSPPGLVGYGLFALLSRALYARGGRRPRRRVPARLGNRGAGYAVLSAGAAGRTSAWRRSALANSIGMTVLGSDPRVPAAQGRCDRCPGWPAPGSPGWPAAVLGAAAGNGVRGWPVGHRPQQRAVIALGIGAGAAVVAVFALVALVLDGGDLRAIAERRLRRAGRGGQEEQP